MVMEMNDFVFEVNIDQAYEKVTPTISKAKCRVFYKGPNRNNTYITNEFAEKLVKSLPYTPVKGIFDEENGDFKAHFMNKGQIYGIVPENPRAHYEPHLDVDGIEREYLTCDVYIYTELYKEANLIPSKGQSMELYRPSVKYSWQIIDGQKYCVLEEGQFFGLQILGDEVEPCFQGAAFFSYAKEVKDFIEQVKSLEHIDEVEKEMNFKLSDAEKYDVLFTKLNPNYNQENNWEVSYIICDIYDEYAIIRNAEGYERAYYQKSEDSDDVIITKQEKCFMMDVSETEKNALEIVQAARGNYENLDVDYNSIATLTEANQNLTTQIEDFTSRETAANEKISGLEEQITNNGLKIADLETQVSNLNSEKENYSATINTLEAENSALKDFKDGVEKRAKQSLIEKYSAHLNEDQLAKYTDEVIASYTIADLEKELSLDYVTNNNASIFSKKDPEPISIPVEHNPVGIERLLDKYEHKN